MSINVYELVTQRILEQLDKGVIPWRKPWKGNAAMNYITRKAYKGINVLLLPFPGEYMSFKQVKDLGGSVRKGEKGHIICFYKPLEIEDKETGEKKQIPFLRYSTVFHLSQIDGIETKIKPVSIDMKIQPLERAQSIFDNYITWSGVSVNHLEGSDKASYSPEKDGITLPLSGSFLVQTNTQAQRFTKPHIAQDTKVVLTAASGLRLLAPRHTAAKN